VRHAREFRCSTKVTHRQGTPLSRASTMLMWRQTRAQ
jgi:hypothetical protein